MATYPAQGTVQHYPLDGLTQGVGVTSASPYASTRDALALLDTSLPAILTESGREGIFVFSSADLSANVTLDPQRAIYIAPTSDATGASGAWVRSSVADYRATWFGVKADGVWNGVTYAGTDDTAALQAAIDTAYALGGGTITLPKGVCVIAGPLKDTGLSNSQIVLPKDTTMTNGRVIQLRGPTGASTTFANETGAIVASTLTAGNGAMIGCKTNVAGFAGGASRLGFYAENVTFRMVENPTNSCLDLRYLPMVQLRNVRVDVPNMAAGTAGAPTFDVVQPTTSTSYGIKGPLNNIPTWNNYDNVIIGGFYTGFKPGELGGGDNININCCKQAIEIGDGSHPSVFGRVLVTNCQSVLKADPALSVNTEIHIRMLDIEHDTNAGSGPNWIEPIGYDIDDSTNGLRGVIWTHNHEDTAPFTKNGAKNLRIQSIRTGHALETAFTTAFPGINTVTEASAVREIRPRISGSILYDSLVANQPSTTGYAGVWMVSNEAAPGPDYRLGAISIKCDGALNSGKFVISTAKAGTVTDWVTVDKNGVLAAANSIIANTAQAAATVALNPGLFVWNDINSLYGMDLGYVGGGFCTRFVTPNARFLSFGGLGNAPTAQSDFTEWARLTSAGMELPAGKALKVNGQQVVGARGASLPADATDLATAIALVNAIKARLKVTGGHGMVAD